jgi:hypothetical protein
VYFDFDCFRDVISICFAALCAGPFHVALL